MKSLDRISKTEAVVLRRMELGEYDYLLTLLTPKHGKLRAVAKGVRKPLSRRSGQTELFTLTDLVLNRGRELPIITQAETKEAFLPLQEDLQRSVLASHFVELLDQFSFEGEENIRAFDLLVSGLSWLCEPEADVIIAARYFEYQLLRVMGFEPSLFECAVSGEALQPTDQFFSFAEGGMVAPQHVVGLQVRRVSLPVFKVMRHFSRSPWSTIRQLRLSKEHLAELESLQQAYITFILERQLKSMGVWRKINREDE